MEPAQYKTFRNWMRSPDVVSKFGDTNVKVDKSKSFSQSVGKEFEQIEEAVPAVAAVIWVIKFAIRYGAWPVIKWLLKKHGGKLFGGAAAAYYIDQGWDWVVENIGEEYAQMLIDNKFNIAMAVGLILGAVALKRIVSKHGEALAKKFQGATEEHIDEIYKQTAGDYARHGGPMPKKKRRGPHPLGGKLVGG
jgi:hypothetical protein